LSISLQTPLPDHFRPATASAGYFPFIVALTLNLSIPVKQRVLRTREESHENSKAGGLIYVTKTNHAFICVTFLRDLGRGTSGPRRRSAWNFRNSRPDIAFRTANWKHGSASDGQHDTAAHRHPRSERNAGIESDQSERARWQLDDES
jgi:hypothetical protein